MGTYNDLCNIIFYFRKLQARRSTLVCGATCGMHMFTGFVDKFSDISDLKYAMALCPAGREIYTKYYQYIHLPFDTKLSTRHVERPSTISPTAKSLTGILQRIRSAPQTQLSKVWLKTWKRFYSDGKCPLDGTWCQRNNCQPSYKGEITPEETDR